MTFEQISNLIRTVNPEVAKGWYATGGCALVLMAIYVAVLYLTNTGVIARATVKEAIRQPVFALMMVIALALLCLNTIWPFFSLGDDIKMLKDCGLNTILFCSLLLTVWTASTSIADEIEGKTAITLLSKPINRREFIVGKYLGIVTTGLWLIAPLSIAFLALVYYKQFYDAREASKETDHINALIQVIQVSPGLLLVAMEMMVMSAVSVAISTRAPMVVNMVSCLAVFIVGHLTPTLVAVSTEGFELVLFMAQLIAAVLPALGSYSIETAVAQGEFVPPSYVGYVAAYTAVYCVIAIVFSFILFDDRDLA